MVIIKNFISYSFLKIKMSIDDGMVYWQKCLLQNLHNEYPYHVDTLLQLGEILKMGDDHQAASEMIGTLRHTSDDDCDVMSVSYTPSNGTRNWCCFSYQS